jgi:hypothetical protein
VTAAPRPCAVHYAWIVAAAVMDLVGVRRTLAVEV